MTNMKAVVIKQAGEPEVLRIETVPIPTPQPGEVLIRVKAFGLNRSELFTRLGHSPSVTFPRILGIEAVGVVEDAPGGEFGKGDVVATAMGGMGRQFDGSYAQFTCVPAAQVQAVATKLDWATLGAIPEMLQTAWGSLFKSLALQNGERLLIRAERLQSGSRPRRSRAITVPWSRRRRANPIARSFCARAEHTRFSSIPARSPIRSGKCFRGASTKCWN